MPLITDISSLLVWHKALHWIAELYFRNQLPGCSRGTIVPLYSCSSNWSLQQKEWIRVSIGHNDFAAMQGCFTCAWGDEKRGPDMSDIWPIYFDKVCESYGKYGEWIWCFFYVVKWKSEPRFWIFVISLVLWIKFAASGDSLFKLVLSGVPLLGKLLNRLIRELQNTKKHTHSCQDPVLIENKSRTWTIFLANWASLTVLNFFQFGCFRAS